MKQTKIYHQGSPALHITRFSCTTYIKVHLHFTHHQGSPVGCISHITKVHLYFTYHQGSPTLHTSPRVLARQKTLTSFIHYHLESNQKIRYKREVHNETDKYWQNRLRTEEHCKVHFNVGVELSVKMMYKHSITKFGLKANKCQASHRMIYWCIMPIHGMLKRCTV